MVVKFGYLQRKVSNCSLFGKERYSEEYIWTCEEGVWGIKKNEELRELFQEPELVSFIR